MFEIIRRFFKKEKALQVPQDFYDVGSTYLNLVKSRILESVVTPERRILPATATPQDQFILLVFLTSYFSVRTDLELSERGLPQSLRDEIWSHLIGVVFDEMNSGSSHTRVFRNLVACTN